MSRIKLNSVAGTRSAILPTVSPGFPNRLAVRRGMRAAEGGDAGPSVDLKSMNLSP